MDGRRRLVGRSATATALATNAVWSYGPVGAPRSSGTDVRSFSVVGNFSCVLTLKLVCGDFGISFGFCLCCEFVPVEGRCVSTFVCYLKIVLYILAKNRVVVQT